MNPSYEIMLDSYTWLGSEYSLEEAKQTAYNYILDVKKKIDEIIYSSNIVGSKIY